MLDGDGLIPPLQQRPAPAVQTGSLLGEVGLEIAHEAGELPGIGW
jgi:hypothetical protein